MIRNHWINADSRPPVNEEILAKVKGFGVCKMMLIEDAEVNKKCSYDPRIWNSVNHGFKWKESKDKFICHDKMIEGWKYIILPSPRIKNELK